MIGFFSAGVSARRRSAPAFLAAALACAALSACVSADPQAAARLSRFDPFTADPRDIAVAVKTDRSIALRTGDVVLRAKLESMDAALAFDETFLLSVEDGSNDTRFSGELMASGHLVTAAVAPEDIERYQAMQARARAAKAKGGNRGNGILSVGIQGACRTAPIPRDVTVRTFMRTEATGEFFPLTGEIRVRSMLGEKALAQIPPC